MALYEFNSADVVVGKVKLVHMSLTCFSNSWLVEMYTETVKDKYQNYNQVEIPKEIIHPTLALMLIGVLQTGCRLRILTGKYDANELLEWVSRFSRSFIIEKVIE